MHSTAEWVSTLPEMLSPRDGLVAIATALEDAKAATNAIIAEYKGGMLPPPPWPQPPELVRAIETLEGGRLLLNQAILLGRGDDKEPHTGPHAAPLLIAGRNLYAGIESMQKAHREGEIKVENLPKLAARAAGKILPTGVGGLLAVAVVLWIVNELGEE